MPFYRLGDDVDDFCIKCKRITNHSIVSVVEEEPAKVRCRTCYNDHDYRRCEIPPSKKDLKKAALMQEVLAAGGQPADDGDASPAEDTPPAPAAAAAEADGAKPRKGGRKVKGAS